MNDSSAGLNLGPRIFEFRVRFPVFFQNGLIDYTAAIKHL